MIQGLMLVLGALMAASVSAEMQVIDENEMSDVVAQGLTITLEELQGNERFQNLPTEIKSVVENNFDQLKGMTQTERRAFMQSNVDSNIIDQMRSRFQNLPSEHKSFIMENREQLRAMSPSERRDFFQQSGLEKPF